MTRISLAKGLTVVTAITDEMQDYESIKRITDVDATGYRLSYSARAPDIMGQVQNVEAVRQVRRSDLATATAYRIVFSPEDPETFPGTTAIGTSSAVIRDLRDHGRAHLTIVGTLDIVGGILSLLAGVPEYKGEVRRVSSDTSRFPVLVNGRRVAVPMVTVAGQLSDGVQSLEVEVSFIDDPANPLVLHFRLGSSSLRTVRIDAPAEAAHDLEQALLDEGRAEVFGLYFEFGSATIRPESEAVLDEVSGLLKRHPDWGLRIEGHTDNVGSAEANVTLSQQRAEAVRQALVRRLGGGGDRLETAGFGASQPKESNATPEGRARNRRVELIRL